MNAIPFAKVLDQPLYAMDPDISEQKKLLRFADKHRTIDNEKWLRGIGLF